MTNINGELDRIEQQLSPTRRLTKDEAMQVLLKILLDNSKILDMIKEIGDSVTPDGKTQLDLLTDRLDEGNKA